MGRFQHWNLLSAGAALPALARSASIAAIATACAGSPLLAQSGGGIEEIVVTAQKREQNVQDVPVAVTAISADTLQVNRVQNVMDLNGLAPGLMARANAGSTGSPSYSMRGIFASASDPSQDRQIASYIDGVYIGGIRGAVFDLPDIQRVEVLRGPQGTLFGRNATAGAVSITTRDPKGEMGGRVEASLGTYNTLRTRVTLDTPQIGMFSAFATYVHDERRGDIRNVGAGTKYDFTSPFHNIVGKTSSPMYLGSRNSESVFAAVKAEPSDAFNVVYKFDWTKNNNTPDARVPLWNGPLLGGIIALQGGDKTYGGYVMQANPEAAQRPGVVNNAFSAPGFTKAQGHLITMNFRASDSLSFKNVTSWRKASALGISSIMGVDGLTVTPGVLAFLPTFPIPVPGVGTVPLPFYTPDRAGQMITGYTGVNYGKYHQFSNEFQVNFDSDPVTVTAGALYFKSRERSSGLPGGPTNFGILVGLGGIPSAIGAYFVGGPGAVAGTVFGQNLSYNVNNPYLLGNIQEKYQRTKSMAVYAQAEVHVTPQLDVVLGGRVTRDEKSQTFVQGGTYNGTAIVGANSVTTPFKKTKPTYSIGANYKVSPDILVYGKYSTAYLSGGASGPLVFQPETVTSWEAGLKSEFFDRHVRLNLALYTASYKNAQSAQSGSNVQSASCGTTGAVVSCAAYGVVVVSNGNVKSTGIEAELTVVPFQGMTLGGQISYSDNKLKNASPALTDGGRPVKLSGVAPWMGGANAQYVTPELFDGTTMLFRLDASYQGKYRNSPFTDIATRTGSTATDPAQLPWAESAARWILNGRIALRDMKVGPMNAEVALWARNLTNNKDTTYLLIFGSQNVNASFQQARTIGMEFLVDF